MQRVVLDPNVLISAVIAPAGTSARLLDAWLDGVFELIVSPKVLSELEHVLLRPKFRTYASSEEVRVYVTLFRNLATHAEDPPLTEELTPDPGDDYLVALALSIHADALISGDRHLLELRREALNVLSPAEALVRLDH
jgi:uncharacterized protein